ncbi:Transposase IS200 like protein [Anatilimnocola aggregata]|uniref:Transposase IS200 like protein n=1 Tax=Anatilimnocola aggregata TaxID=2528021 RepID=A0A517YLZ2_9BACT|nr:transposase [Anatilimnocola aggregata]QDU31231.1 Transposase IS200 like protein [Anatilimnocola aggregata]
MRGRPQRVHRQDFNTPGHAHELTFSCYRRFNFLKAERTCNWLVESIERARVKHDFDLWAFVIMPNHAHVIVRPRPEKYRIGRIRSGIKLPVAKQAIQFLIDNESPWLERITRRRGHRTERLFWQSGGGYDRNITNGKTLLKMIEYLHDNPVRKEWCQRGSEWKWSSAAFYEGGKSPLTPDPIPAEWLTDT